MKIVVVGLLTISASPALADWQYSQWGMTPQQLVKASNGTANFGRSPDQSIANELVLAIGRYESSGITFNISFRFNNNRLAAVVLYPSQNTDCQLLTTIMARTYGFSGRRGDVLIESWRDQKSGNHVAYTHFGLTNYCFIQYKPLPTPGGAGGL